MNFHAPHIDYAALSPVLALTVGICIVLLGGLVRRDRVVVPLLTLLTLGITAGLCIWQFGERKDLVTGALRLDELAIAIALIALTAAAFTVVLSLGEPAAEQSGRGEYHALLLGSVLGMVLLAQAQNLVSFFVALELLSIPLYVLCGSNLRRAPSLESGLKYLIVGSLGSATLLYGLALIYGGSGSTDFNAIAAGIGKAGVLGDPLILIGIALAATGLAFKISIAPFHQWTPDVYEGAPTPITAFMAVATKAAAFAVFIRFFEVALGPESGDWDVALAVLAAISIVVGNVGALGQSSLKRLLGYSGVAQAGYMLVGLLVATKLGIDALVFYLLGYTVMNLAAFAVIVIRERETPFGDDIHAIEGLGRERPLLAWPLTISMLGLAGLPGTVGFIGKLYLIEAAVKDSFTWLGVAIVIGTMVSLAYYLRVIAAVWMTPGRESARDPATGAELPAMAGGETIEAGGVHAVPIGLLAGLAAAATITFGVIPQPLIDFASNAGQALAAFL
ncbi:MAG: NADH-quinone oxidoreductase subunit [Solirubrobacterales bacterium]|jgi:NADH-quinone oxidoreductase subunit N|nr:NADH-quinone oxidoreductase subunit [Solirubrobacterales bacterium]